jgi:predicted GTPase
MSSVNFFNEVKKVAAHGAAFSKENELFDTFISSTIDAFKKTIPLIESNHPLHEIMDTTTANLHTTFNQWGKQLADNEHTQKFRSDFDDKFLIIIYGKVKAGKSTLGNFIANEFKSKTGTAVEFFQYDKAGQERDSAKFEESDESEFATKIVECTSTIQGFKADGLAWIDTPGLGSMTDVNGAKAKEYIEKADLVIFPLSSDSPGRQTDLIEIEEIIKNKGKNVLVVITKSDTTEDDEENGEIVKKLMPKSEQNRRDQEGHIKDEIAKLQARSEGLIKSDVLSISVKLAAENIDGSNLEQFFALLADVVKNDGVELKAKEPLNRLKAFKGRLLNEIDDFSFAKLKKEIDSFGAESKKIKDEFKTNADLAKARTVADCLSLIDREVKKEHFTNPIEGKKKADLVVEKVNQLIKNNINDVMSSVFSDIQKHTAAIQINIGHIDTELKDKVEHQEIERKTRVGNWRSGNMFLDNSLVNSVVGDPYEVVTEMVTIDIKTGDNYFEIVNNMKSQFTANITQEIQKQKNSLEKIYFSPLERFVSEFNTQYNNAISQIK